MQERPVGSNNVLIEAAPRLVGEAFDQDPELARAFDFTSNNDHENEVTELLTRTPADDTDKRGWLFLLGTCYLGYKFQELLIHGDKEVTQEDFSIALQSQLADDESRWGDTWKARPIEGQLDRTLERYRDYKDMHDNGGQEFPWLKAAGGIIINLYRLDNPDYQK